MTACSNPILGLLILFTVVAHTSTVNASPIQLIDDPGFETLTNTDQLLYLDYLSAATLAVNTTQPVAGDTSLAVAFDGYGQLRLGHYFAYGSAVQAYAAQASTLLRLDIVSSGEALQVCLFAYYQDESVPVQTCEAVSGEQGGLASIALSVDLDPAKAVSRFYFRFTSQGNAASEYTLDSVQIEWLPFDATDETAQDFEPLDLPDATAVAIVTDTGFENTEYLQGQEYFDYMASAQVQLLSEGAGDDFTAINGDNSVWVQLQHYSQLRFSYVLPYGSATHAQAVQLFGVLEKIAQTDAPPLLVCAMAYYVDQTTPAQSCQEVSAVAGDATAFNIVLELDPSIAIARVYYRLSQQGSGVVDYLLDDAHFVLYALGGITEEPDPEPDPDPDPEPDPDPDPEPDPTDPPVAEPFNFLILAGTTTRPIKHSDFEIDTSAIHSASNGSTYQLTAANPISGSQSLQVQLAQYGQLHSEHSYPYNSGHIGEALQAYGQVNILAAQPGAQLKACAIVYYQDHPRQEQCQWLPADTQGVQSFHAVLDLNPAWQISRFFYDISLVGNAPLDFVLDDMDLVFYAIEPNDDGVNLQDDVTANGPASNNTPRDVPVTLYPHATATGQQTVSLGLPLPPGVLLSTDQLQVLDEAGDELPISVRSLASWQSMPPQSMLCSDLHASGNPGLRSVLIQFEKNVTDNTPVTITVRLNQPRTTTDITETPVMDTFRLVDDGTYADSSLLGGGLSHHYTIHEPAIMAAVDHQYLACTNLTVLNGVSFSAPTLQTVDQGQLDFFYTTINEFFGRPVQDSDYNDFYQIHTPWLYDRAQTFFNGYIRSGNIDMLREAHRAADQYRQNLYTSADCIAQPFTHNCVGAHRIKSPLVDAKEKDAKYSYSENMATHYYLTGDPRTLAQIKDPAKAAMKQTDLQYDHHTERGRANALLTAVVDYELTGDETVHSYLLAAVDSLHARQNQLLDGNAPNGCFNYSPESEVTVASFSTWMSSLLAHALARAYHATNDSRIPGMLVELAQCVVDRGLYRSTVFNGSDINPLPEGRLMPYYIARSFGAHEDVSNDDPFTLSDNGLAHALDVSVITALGAYYTTDDTQRQAFLAVTHDLLETQRVQIHHWTRDLESRPAYRLAPPRKYNWQYKNLGIIAWILANSPSP